MRRPERLVWWEPYRATFEASRRELAATGVLNWGFWLRVEVIVGALLAGAIVLFRTVYPGAFLPIAQLIGCVLAAPLALLALICLKFMAPVRIEVRPDRITLNQGDSSVRIARERLVGATVLEDDAGIAWMVLEYRTPRGKDRRRMVAVSRSVDLAELKELLERGV